jgi:hypothetical protein
MESVWNNKQREMTVGAQGSMNTPRNRGCSGHLQDVELLRFFAKPLRSAEPELKNNGWLNFIASIWGFVDVCLRWFSCTWFHSNHY